ncbi:hypothetical protein A7982_13517 [Minicystis rosea]|nr:hypothetical protein A7982_13517 [Minicystis rosea]
MLIRPRFGVFLSTVRLRETVLALAAAGLVSACWPFATGPTHASMAEIVQQGDALAISDALEELIAEGKDSPADRELALNAVRTREQSTAAYAFARAAITGRVVQSRGLTGAGLVSDVEKWALLSKKLEPNFREGAAARLLGTLYVMAPAGWLEHGDSEQGLELLEGLVKAHPEKLENHLRLAEAYIALGDTAPATPYLCRVRARRAELRRDDQQLLDHLFADAGHPTCPNAAAQPAKPASSAPAAPASSTPAPSASPTALPLKPPPAPATPPR